jgi:hypothetical protein
MAKKASPKKPAPAKKRTATTKARVTPARRQVAKKSTRPTKQPAAASPPPARRAVFIDVENTSGESDLLKVVDHLQIDRKAQPTELYALGNWKSVGTRVARMLAGLGAQLIHSAPAVGVRDWSDLWIAVAAGRWLATAGPGDVLDIVSDDRAFDAVGDAAAAAGVVFHRTSYRAIPGGAPAAAAPEARPHRRRRGGRGRRAPAVPHRPSSPEPQSTRSAAPAPIAPPPAVSDEEAHAASHAQISATLARLAGGTSRWINLDALANALKTEGFTRPPGSPRLVTRLRRMKDVEVSANGMVRLVSGGAEPPAAPLTGSPAGSPAEHTADAGTPPRRPRRRGGRGRRRPRAETAAAAPAPLDDTTP